MFEPVTHAAQFIDVKGEPTRERQHLSLIYNKLHAPSGTLKLRPGPLRLSLENQTDVRVLPTIWIAGDELHHLLGKRKPFLTAKRLLTNQTFRDIYSADTLNVDQRLKITSLTFLFTDLKGSTALYERVGDLVAFDLVRAHFQALLEIIAAEKGAVVKTIGDAVMATFHRPRQAMAAALRMRDAMESSMPSAGPRICCSRSASMRVPASRSCSTSARTISARPSTSPHGFRACRPRTRSMSPDPVIDAPAVTAILDKEAITPIQKQAALRGIADKMVVYEIP